MIFLHWISFAQFLQRTYLFHRHHLFDKNNLPLLFFSFKDNVNSSVWYGLSPLPNGYPTLLLGYRKLWELTSLKFNRLQFTLIEGNQLVLFYQRSHRETSGLKRKCFVIFLTFTSTATKNKERIKTMSVLISFIRTKPLNKWFTKYF